MSQAIAIGIPAKKKATGPNGKEVTLSTSVGGSIYGTSVGGTRYQYDAATLLKLKASPLSKSPAVAANIPNIPGITKVGSPALRPSAGQAANDAKASPKVSAAAAPAVAAAAPLPAATKAAKPVSNGKKAGAEDDGVFEMDA